MKKYQPFRFLFIAVSVFLAIFLSSSEVKAQGAFSSTNNLTPVPIFLPDITGEKPQSKVWTYAGKWWAVFPNDTGTQLWLLEGNTWNPKLQLSANTTSRADCKVLGDAVHILLYQGVSSEIVSVTYNQATSTYVRSSSGQIPITLDNGVETASIDVDGNGRMWLASAGTTTVNVRWSDAPYTIWSNPTTIATGINDDDICAIISLPGKIGVLWSNQTTKAFGFRTHLNGTDPSVWTNDEVPASQSAEAVGAGMADDHINLKASSDGTLFAAVKTSYDATGYTRIALLVRRPNGTWDNMYPVTTGSVGTRPVVVLNEAKDKLKVFYTSVDGGGNILYKESPISSISFGPQQTLFTGNYNNLTTAKENYNSEIVLLASSSSQIVGALATDAIITPGEALVGHWQMEQEAGNTLSDASTYKNNATTTVSPTRVTGQIGQSLQFDGSTQFATVPDNASLDITGSITLAAWIKPQKTATQYIIKKGIMGSSNGYELSLSGGGLVFFRINQQTNGDTYRLNSVASYPISGTQWMHIAATYDKPTSTIRIYINGIENSSTTLPAQPSISTNDLPLSIGAQSDGVNKFQGAIDEARVYNIALSGPQISALAALPPQTPNMVSPQAAATGVATSPALSWEASANAVSYRVQVSTMQDFSSTVFDLGDIAATSTTISGLLNNTTYYWRVNASNSSGTSAWSSSRSFTTAPGVTAVESNGAGFALDLDGADDYVTVPDNNTLDLTSKLTIEAWIKLGKSGTQRIVSKSTLDATSGYELSISAGNIPFVRFNQATPTPQDNNRLNAVTTLLVGTWYHIAATFDGSTTRIYVNGKEEASKATAIIIATNNIDLTIGAQPTAASPYPFGGIMDEVRIWNVARSESEIKAAMTSKLSGSEAGLVGYWRMDETSGTTLIDGSNNFNTGKMANMTESDHVWSGASLGNASSYDYDAAGGYSALLSHSDGDGISVLSASNEVQVYRVDAKAARPGATAPAGYTVDPLRSWGVKVNNMAAPSYTLVYNYKGHPGINVPSDLRLLRRDNLADVSWEDTGVIPNEGTNTLTFSANSNAEYALASITPNNPLPVTLSLFIAKAENNGVLLKWETSSERNSSGFFVERSKDGKTFISLDFVPSKGANSSVKLAYSYKDLDAGIGVTYYKLKQIDLDGKEEYSKVVGVNLLEVTQKKVKLFPNPTSEAVQLDLTKLPKGVYQIRILSPLGLVVKQFSANGGTILQFTVNELSKGPYFIQIQGLPEIQTLRLIKQ
jgi:hypothetical protein